MESPRHERTAQRDEPVRRTPEEREQDVRQPRAESAAPVADRRFTQAVRPAWILRVERGEDEQEIDRDREGGKPPRFAQQGGDFRRERVVRYLARTGFF